MNRMPAPLLGLGTTFAGFGVLYGAWTARLPALEQRLSLDSGQLGTAIFAASLSGTIVLPLAGWGASRFSGRGPLWTGLALMAAGLTVSAFAPNLPLFIAAGCGIGAGFGVVDVTASAHGLALERSTNRRLLSSLHGMWSVGLLVGSGTAALAAVLAAGPRLQFPVVAAGVLGVSLFAVPRSTSVQVEAADDAAHFVLPRGVLALPAIIGFCAVFAETATINWSAVFLSGPARASGAVAAAGVVAFSVAMVLSRFAGDALTARWGISGIALRGGLLSMAGMLVAIGTRSPIPALLGLALVGAGCSVVVPALFRLAGSVPGVSAAAGIAAVATAGYLGSVANGPTVGFLAREVGLSRALLAVVVASAVVASLGLRLDRGARRCTASDSR